MNHADLGIPALPIVSGQQLMTSTQTPSPDIPTQPQTHIIKLQPPTAQPSVSKVRSFTIQLPNAQTSAAQSNAQTSITQPSTIQPQPSNAHIIQFEPQSPKKKDMVAGVYILKHPFYQEMVKIGCSTNIGERIRSSDYRTMFRETDMPTLIGYITHQNFTTLDEVKYLERCVHRLFQQERESPNRELFTLNLDDPAVIEKIEIFFHNFAGDAYHFPHGDISIPASTSDLNDVPTSTIITEIEAHHGVIQPLQHQVPILQQLQTFYETGTVGKLILPCGYGKMYIVLFYLHQRDYRNVVIFVPSLILMHQFVEVATQILSGWNITPFSGENQILSMGERNLIISTYQSSPLLNFSPDFVVYDEAHRTCVNNCTQEPSLFHNTVLMFPETKKIFMTATEKIVCSNDNDVLIGHYSMKSEEYGEYILKKTFQDGIQEQVISNYVLAVPLTDTSPADVIISAMAELDLRHVLVYTNRLEDARALAETLRDNGVNSYYLDGSFNHRDRTRILNDFQQAPTGVLCSVKVLQEGVSLPIVDSVYFVDSRSSEIDITQMIGRALRIHPTKTLATIIIPGDMLKNKPLLNTLVRMNPSLNQKIVGFSGSRRISRQLDRRTLIAIGERVNFIRLKSTDGVWEFKLRLCQEWQRLNPGQKIPRTLVFGGVRIGLWLFTQKNGLKRIGRIKITEDRLIQLNTLYSWTRWLSKLTNPDSEWTYKLEISKDFELSHPNDKIRKDTEHQDVKIGEWLSYQWCSFNGNGNGIINEYRLGRLNELRTWVNWLIKLNNPDVEWDQKLTLSEEFETINPELPILVTTEYRGIKIGSWFNNQKNVFAGNVKGNPMSEARKLKLNHLRCWRAYLNKFNNPEAPWLSKQELSKEFETVNPDQLIKHSTIYKGIKIGTWLYTQIKALNNNNRKSMNEFRFNRLFELRSWCAWCTKNNILLPQSAPGHISLPQLASVPIPLPQLAPRPIPLPQSAPVFKYLTLNVGR